MSQAHATRALKSLNLARARYAIKHRLKRNKALFQRCREEQRWHAMLLKKLCKKILPHSSQEEEAFCQDPPPSIPKASGVTWPILLGQEEVHCDSPLIPRRQFQEDDCCVSSPCECPQEERTSLSQRDGTSDDVAYSCEHAHEERTSAQCAGASDVENREHSI